MSVENPRIVLAGSVNSSRKTLKKLFEHKMNVVGVLGLSPGVASNVSGYVDLETYADEAGVYFRHFDKINSDGVLKFVRECRPDYLFVVGLSQLVRKKLLNIPEVGCIGFHPTKLPEGRGRGAVAWLILGKAPGAATFFLMGEGMDDGPILAQKEFEVAEEDYAQDVIDKIVEKIGDCLDELLPQLKSGTAKPKVQDHTKATYLGKRNPEDGWIDWEQPAEEIVRLVRAVSRPLPGAFCSYQGQKIIIEKARVGRNLNHIGVTGRFLKIDPSKGILVQAGKGCVWLQEFREVAIDEFKVGSRVESELDHKIENLKSEVEMLNKILKDE